MTAAHGVVAVLVALVAGGSWCLMWAAQQAWRTARRERAGTVVPGRVVALERTGGSDDEPALVTVAEFTDRRGTVRRARSRSARTPAAHAIGQAVRISYEAEGRGRADIVHEAPWLLSIAFLGAALVVIGLLILWGLRTGAYTVAS